MRMKNETGKSVSLRTGKGGQDSITLAPAVAITPDGEIPVMRIKAAYPLKQNEGEHRAYFKTDSFFMSKDADAIAAFLRGQNGRAMFNIGEDGRDSLDLSMNEIEVSHDHYMPAMRIKVLVPSEHPDGKPRFSISVFNKGTAIAMAVIIEDWLERVEENNEIDQLELRIRELEEELSETVPLEG